MSRGCLIVFAKAPRPGRVKTRFAPPLSLEQAAGLYEAMLADVLETSAREARAFDLEAVLAFHPPDAFAEFAQHAPPSFRLQIQRGLGLSQRMANAFAEAAAGGAPLALLRGSDSPALGKAHIGSMLEALESGDDLVLTPDLGGGYVMIGQRIPTPEVFEVPMSNAEVLGRTLALAGGLGLACSTTQVTFDLDTVSDLRAFDRLSDTELSDLCPRTVEAIADLRLNGVL